MTSRSFETVLVVALSGLGKSWLADAEPEGVYDGDRCIYAAVAEAFPELESRARLRAWRELARRRPWEGSGSADEEALALWAGTRRSMIAALHDVVRSGHYRLVVTSLVQPDWTVKHYYGIERHRYLEHLRRCGRALDNGHGEAANDRLEGFAPLTRLAPGTHLAQCPRIRAWAGMG
ncbi:hypothetical protein PPSIR1_41009 [Plesiocystis pacifica SIR-1]|uniref:Uncharacterized protein n=1 Tax=Plesiocystis pacifica SIR-1 TaxID=391625 RepID=A6GG10_9BACT|nr:hypothetical protein [Plesiocystis pacifica]EDM75197.1 hypothetical protein PPSIR1_41009 [Plesiocystis pacifica SIR-1]